MRLGIFDSGLGGLTVVKAIRDRYPSIDIQYLGDTARVPYGGRSPEVIVRYALECARFLTSKKPDAIIVACNTVSAIAIPALREQNEIPVLGVIEPAARAASHYSKVGLLATKATVDSKAYEIALKNLNASTELVSNASPLLVPMVEEGWNSSSEQQKVMCDVVRYYLIPLVKAKVQAVILGCTHYPLLKNIFEQELEKLNYPIPLIDSGVALAGELAKHLDFKDQNLIPKMGELKIFTTDEPRSFKQIAESYLTESISSVDRAEL